MSGDAIVLAAGGTGGHMFPAEALARALLARGRRVHLVTDRRGQAFGRDLPEVAVHRIRAPRLGGGALSALRAVGDLLLGYGEARGLLRGLGCGAVVGFGGYPSVPTLLAARRLGLPILIHEQNAHLGRANRWLSRHARVVATSFPNVRGLRPGDERKTVLTGNPVRGPIAGLRGQGYRPPEAPDGPIQVLVLGGSQGAHVLSEVVPAAMARLPDPLKARLQVSQQCRPEDLAEARKAFQRSGVASTLDSFFRDVPARLARAHLVVCRAGASTVAELAAAGRPAILVPYPFATDDHQTANAEAFAEAGAGWLMPQNDGFSPDGLARSLEALLGDTARLAAAAEAARRFGPADAADRLAEAVLGLVTRHDPGNGLDQREAAE